jgi:hypothetical protein
MQKEKRKRKRKSVCVKKNLHRGAKKSSDTSIT